MYSLFLDKSTDFVCDVSVKNASLKNAFARMIVKTDDVTLLFEGKLENGQCLIPIHRLKGVLDENCKGTMSLEIIVEDTYFSPWKDEFITEQHTAVKVAIKEQIKPTKPTVAVSVKKSLPKLTDPARDIVFICEKVGVRKADLKKKKNEFKQVVSEYFKANPEFLAESKKYITEAILALK
jgi:hypothetical protein